MRIETLLKTYNRADVLPAAIGSWLAARQPAGVETTLTVVDNNSSDHTKAVVDGFTDRHPQRIRYVFAPVQGTANALHEGVMQSNADVIALFDDDEEVQTDWLEVLARNFADEIVEYLGGEMRPNWLAPRPDWLAPRFSGAVGIVHNGSVRRQYGSPGFDAMPVGGNMAIRMSTLARCKPWSECNLPHGDDRFIYNELQAIRAVGFYEPALVIMHQIPAKRLTKRYQRYWAAHEGCINALVDQRQPPTGRTALRVPLWRWRRAAGSLANLAFRRGEAAELMQHELQLREFWGYLRTAVGRSPEDHAYRSALK